MTHTDYQNTFEGGTDGANITAANSALGTGNTAFAAVYFNNAEVGSGGNSAITYSTSAAVKGTLGAHLADTATSNSYFGFTVTSGSVGYGSITYKAYPGAPSAFHTILRLNSGSITGASVASLLIATNGKVAVFDASNAEIVAARSASALTPGNTYRFELMASPGTTSTNGTIGYKVYNSDGTVFASWSSTTVNAGTAAIAGCRFWAPLSSSGWSSGINVDIAYLRISDNTSDWVGWVATTTPPAAAAALTSSVALVDARSSTVGDGSSLTYEIDIASGPSGWADPTAVSGLSGVWIVPLPEGSDGVVTVTVTQGDGQTDTIDVTIPQATGGGGSVGMQIYRVVNVGGTLTAV